MAKGFSQPMTLFHINAGDGKSCVDQCTVQHVATGPRHTANVPQMGSVRSNLIDASSRCLPSVALPRFEHSLQAVYLIHVLGRNQDDLGNIPCIVPTY